MLIIICVEIIPFILFSSLKFTKSAVSRNQHLFKLNVNYSCSLFSAISLPIVLLIPPSFWFLEFKPTTVSQDPLGDFVVDVDGGVGGGRETQTRVIRPVSLSNVRRLFLCWKYNTKSALGQVEKAPRGKWLGSFVGRNFSQVQSTVSLWVAGWLAGWFLHEPPSVLSWGVFSAHV